MLGVPFSQDATLSFSATLPNADRGAIPLPIKPTRLQAWDRRFRILGPIRSPSQNRQPVLYAFYSLGERLAAECGRKPQDAFQDAAFLWIVENVANEPLVDLEDAVGGTLEIADR